MSSDSFPTRKEIEGDQLSKLRELVNALIPDNPFYARRLEAAGFAAAPESVDAFISKMPFTYKKEIVEDQRTYPPYGSNLTFALDLYTRFNQTSATTGTPMRWLDTPENWEQLLDNWITVFQAAGVTRADHVYFAFSFGPFLGFWTAFGAAERMGCMALPGGGLNSAARLRAILDNSATVLCCTPTYAIRLGQVAVEERIDLRESKVKAIIVAGEPGGSVPATREHIESLWPGARVYDHYGMTEVGPVCFECPQRRGVLHVIEAAYLPEVIDPQWGKAVQPGETGELILTTLLRNGSPLLRYRTGDLVQLSDKEVCECGRADMALKGGILGRADDMLLVRGANLYPSGVEEIIRRHPEIAEFRVEIRTERAMTELSILIELSPECDNHKEIEERVKRELRTAFNLRIPVKVAPEGSLPRFEMKAKRWVRVNND